MTAIDLQLEGDGCWPDLVRMAAEGRLIDGMAGLSIGLALLADGTARGRPSVTLRVDLPDGRAVLTRTTLTLLTQAVRAMQVHVDMIHGSFTCPLCGLTSFHPDDAANRYCGACHKFF
jgi:hypothetical protein